jgi:uncharacterized protein with HEPN domain
MAAQKTLQDIADHLAELIAEFHDYSAQLQLPDSRLDRKTQRSLERVLQNITEATTRIPDEEKQKAPHIPWRNIVDMGNKLRHDYDDINIEYILNFQKTRDLEQLLEAVKAMDLSAPQKRRNRREQ